MYGHLWMPSLRHTFLRAVAQMPSFLAACTSGMSKHVCSSSAVMMTGALSAHFFDWPPLRRGKILKSESIALMSTPPPGPPASPSSPSPSSLCAALGSQSRSCSPPSAPPPPAPPRFCGPAPVSSLARPSRSSRCEPCEPRSLLVRGLVSPTSPPPPASAAPWPPSRAGAKGCPFFTLFPSGDGRSSCAPGCPSASEVDRGMPRMWRCHPPRAAPRPAILWRRAGKMWLDSPPHPHARAGSPRDLRDGTGRKRARDPPPHARWPQQGDHPWRHRPRRRHPSFAANTPPAAYPAPASAPHTAPAGGQTAMLPSADQDSVPPASRRPASAPSAPARARVMRTPAPTRRPRRESDRTLCDFFPPGVSVRAERGPGPRTTLRSLSRGRGPGRGPRRRAAQGAALRPGSLALPRAAATAAAMRPASGGGMRGCGCGRAWPPNACRPRPPAS